MPVPIQIIGIDVASVGTPRNDGSAGSALYMVPIRLSRVLTAREADLLVANFDRPVSWSLMHRPGIARVSSDLLLLDGTTVDEVKEYHAKTVRLAVDATNAAEAEFRRRDAVAADSARANDDRHRRHVAGVADDIDFG